MIGHDEIDKQTDYVFKVPFGENESIKFIADSITMSYINESTVDYVTDLIKAGFEIRNNPRAEMGCSCGTSFAPKLD